MSGEDMGYICCRDKAKPSITSSHVEVLEAVIGLRFRSGKLRIK